MVLHRLYLSSDQADKYPLGVDRTDSVVFDLTPGISLSGRESMYVRLESCSFPIIQPNVNPANNTFVLLLVGDELSVVTIPPAQYTSGEALSSAVNSTSQMIAAGSRRQYLDSDKRDHNRPQNTGYEQEFQYNDSIRHPGALRQRVQSAVAQLSLSLASPHSLDAHASGGGGGGGGQPAKRKREQLAQHTQVQTARQRTG
ncbi:hypothetical protein T492DRAFT_1127146 [Pavlovales sp. CCMP2436]|nr:hypothetical protein T492DRAFT_1127146 [Pavlovales sp. CCMP2436]